jgi:hypothetical protein
VLFPFDKHDPNLSVVTPDGLACSRGLVSEYEIKDLRNAHSSLDFQTRASLGHIPNRTGNRMFSEKDFPGFQHSPSRRRLASLYECSLLNIGDQSEVRDWIAGVNGIADLLQR